VKHWEIIADRLGKAGWSLGWVSAVDSRERTIWIVDAHRAATTDPPQRLERLLFRFETLVDSELRRELVNRSPCCVAPEYLPTAIRK
jgi:hypothetical protein